MMGGAGRTRQAEAGATEAEMDRLLREVRAEYWSKLISENLVQFLFQTGQNR
jgi:hypothetical protein